MVALQVMAEDGGLLACALCAACAALVDAAVPLARTFGGLLSPLPPLSQRGFWHHAACRDVDLTSQM